MSKLAKNRYIGSLCQKNHEYKKSSGSLRNYTRGECIECRKLICKKYVQNNKIKHNKNGAAWNRKRRQERPFWSWANSIMHRCGQCNLPFNLDEKYLKELLEKQQNKCYWFAVKISIDHPTMHPAKATVDRLIPEKGYIKGNVVWASSFVNRGRSNCPVDQFEIFLTEALNGIKYIVKQ